MKPDVVVLVVLVGVVLHRVHSLPLKLWTVSVTGTCSCLTLLNDKGIFTAQYVAPSPPSPPSPPSHPCLCSRVDLCGVKLEDGLAGDLFAIGFSDSDTASENFSTRTILSLCFPSAVTEDAASWRVVQCR